MTIACPLLNPLLSLYYITAAQALYIFHQFNSNMLKKSFRVTNKRRSILSLTKKKAEVPGTSTAAMMLKMHRRLRMFMLGGFVSTFPCRRPKSAAIYSGTKAKTSHLLDDWTTLGGILELFRRFVI